LKNTSYAANPGDVKTAPESIVLRPRLTELCGHRPSVQYTLIR
jgi:hypothetical protein